MIRNHSEDISDLTAYKRNKLFSLKFRDISLNKRKLKFTIFCLSVTQKMTQREHKGKERLKVKRGERYTWMLTLNVFEATAVILYSYKISRS